MHAPTPVLSKLAPHLHMRATQESTLARLAALLFLAAAPMEISASVTAHDCTPVSLCPGRRMLPMGHASRLNIHGSFWASARDSPQIEALQEGGRGRLQVGRDDGRDDAAPQDGEGLVDPAGWR